MGALTLKSFPFELRGWDIEKFEHIDPSDSFASNIRVYVNNDQIIQIEPEYDNNGSGSWITDKCRQFFDGIFKNQTGQKFISNIWSKISKKLVQNIYTFNICKNQFYNNYFFTIIFENISIETLSLLTTISQKYSFIKIKRADNSTVNNDFETDFQLNAISYSTKLNKSDICLLVSTNPRYQGYKLNLKLRQRFFKGNFKCLLIGSLIDLTFPVSIIGSNTKLIKSFVEGNNLNCQEVAKAKNTLVVLNDDVLKRSDELLNVLKPLNYISKLKHNSISLNTLNSSIYTNANINLNNFPTFNEKSLDKFNSLYLIGTQINRFPNIKKSIKLRVLGEISNRTNQIDINKILIDQNFNINQSLNFSNKLEHLFLPTSHLFQNSECFITTEGVTKKTSKIIFDKKTKNDWQILRNLFKKLNNKNFFMFSKDYHLITSTFNTKLNFKNFVYLMYFANHTISKVNAYLMTKNKSFFLNKQIIKTEVKKIRMTKLKYWLDDFFTGGRDDFSQNSLTLINCSRIIRLESANCF